MEGFGGGGYFQVLLLYISTIKKPSALHPEGGKEQKVGKFKKPRGWRGKKFFITLKILSQRIKLKARSLRKKYLWIFRSRVL